MKLNDVSIINLVLSGLILLRISWQFLDYTGLGIILMIFYFIAFLGVLGENIWGFWWVVILGFYELINYFIAEGVCVYALIFSILLIGLSLAGILGLFRKKK